MKFGHADPVIIHVHATFLKNFMYEYCNLTGTFWKPTVTSTKAEDAKNSQDMSKKQDGDLN
ncbi:Protein of unknown function [Cotesia congregata]|uniref:Uncharacterized protein n=1 Tax=Cotesia congregata TaxID=51543 RepID=A0A8J2ELB6_COTCN|nr:Protein of unknown function [Cotesia congregata]